MIDHVVYEFGRFRLDPAEHLLLQDGTPVAITEKAFRVLVVLVRNGGHLVEKSQIVTAVWGDTFIDEGNLTVTISLLRKVLGDNRGEKRSVETVSKQGYRFLPLVTRVPVVIADAEVSSQQPEEGTKIPIPPKRAKYFASIRMCLRVPRWS